MRDSRSTTSGGKAGTFATVWGIKEHHGYARERYRITPDFVVKVDPALGNLGVLLEPTNRRMVLENDVVFGSVNANRRHYEAGAKALADADKGWLARLITRSVPLDSWHEAYKRQPTDVKVVLEFDAGTPG